MSAIRLSLLNVQYVFLKKINMHCIKYSYKQQVCCTLNMGSLKYINKNFSFVQSDLACLFTVKVLTSYFMTQCGILTKDTI